MFKNRLITALTGKKGREDYLPFYYLEFFGHYFTVGTGFANNFVAQF